MAGCRDTHPRSPGLPRQPMPRANERFRHARKTWMAGRSSPRRRVGRAARRAATALLAMAMVEAEARGQPRRCWLQPPQAPDRQPRQPQPACSAPPGTARPKCPARHVPASAAPPGWMAPAAAPAENPSTATSAETGKPPDRNTPRAAPCRTHPHRGNAPARSDRPAPRRSMIARSRTTSFAHHPLCMNPGVRIRMKNEACSSAASISRSHSAPRGIAATS